MPLVVLSNETKNFKIHKELTELLTETLVPTTRTRTTTTTTTTSDTYRVLPQWRVALITRTRILNLAKKHRDTHSSHAKKKLNKEV